VDETAIESLRELGLSLYESRVYLGLLAHGTQNGNELSRTSNVPSSKVYWALDKLVARGIVNQVVRRNGAEYFAIAPEKLVERFRSQYGRAIDYLDKTLPSLADQQAVPDIVQIASTEAIIEHAKAILDGASTEVLISGWDESIGKIRDDLIAADGRGVRVFAMIYGELALPVGSWLRHSYQGTVASRIAGHMLTLVADGRNALIAHFPDNGKASAVHTENPVLCLVVEEYLRHDLILQHAKTMTGYEEWDRWLHADKDVRALTLGRTGRESPIQPLEAPVRSKRRKRS
jgi:HTH-type transcriptional regulator, sugar sensing transcriptional regulator